MNIHCQYLKAHIERNECLSLQAIGNKECLWCGYKISNPKIKD